MSTDIVIGGDHGKGAFRSIININENVISVRTITIIFWLANVKYKKENGEILGSIVISPIWDRLKYICSGRFLGWKH